MNKYFNLILILTMAAITGACGIYSFSGVSIDYEKVKTISIDNFFNETNGGPPNMNMLFSNEIRDYYQQNTNLQLVTANGDLHLEGGITGYRLTPVAPTAGGAAGPGAARGGAAGIDAAALTRLTIEVTVSYVNTTDDTFDFDNRRFSFFSDFDNNQTLTAIEDQLIEEIFDQIILDIFNASVANW